MFLVSGLIVRELGLYFSSRKRISDGIIYFDLFYIVLDSLISNFLSLLIVCNLLQIKVKTLSSLSFMFDELKILGINLILSSLFAVMLYMFKKFLISKHLRNLKNIILSKTEYVNHTGFISVWDEMMTEEGINKTWMVISIYRDATYVCSGMISQYSSTNVENFELQLVHCAKN